MEGPNGEALPLKKELEELTETNIDEVLVALDLCEQKIRNIADDPHVMAEYEKKSKEIARLKETLLKDKDVKSFRQMKLDKIMKPWLEKLQAYIGIVDLRFQKYMQALNCAGEVTLKMGGVDGGDEDFENWGIELKVKYRKAASLQVLNAQVHSGGERSVATIMFLLALQDQMVCPFRCVDEINQGMDEVFERLVLSRIVASATDKPKTADPTSHSGQYFLITPKLLPNLEDMEHPDVTLCIIYNGPYAMKGGWDNEAIVGGAKRKSLSGNTQQSQAGGGEDEDGLDVDGKGGGAASSSSGKKSKKSKA